MGGELMLWQRRPSGLLLPAHEGLGAFAWPTEQTYVSGVSEALGALTPEIKARIAEYAVPVSHSVETVSALCTQLGGFKVGQAVTWQQALSVFTNLVGVAQNVFNVVASAVGASKAVTDSVSSVCSAVPLLGSVISLVMSIVAAEPAGTPPGAGLEQARVACRDNMIDLCAASEIMPRPSRQSPTPSDLFRKVAQYGPAKYLPVSLGTIFVGLCWPETQGWGPSRSDHAVSGWADIPKDRKRAMWACIKGLMAGVRDPVIGATRLQTDDGKVLGPLLMELLRREAMDHGETWLREQMAKVATSGYIRQRVYGQGCSPTKCVSCDENCSYLIDMGGLIDGAFNLVDAWDKQLEELMATYQSRLAETSAANEGQKTIVLGNAQTAVMLTGVVAAGTVFKKKAAAQSVVGLSTPGKLALAAGGLGGAYLLYRGAKAARHRLRRRP